MTILRFLKRHRRTLLLVGVVSAIASLIVDDMFEDAMIPAFWGTFIVFFDVPAVFASIEHPYSEMVWIGLWGIVGWMQYAAVRCVKHKLSVRPIKRFSKPPKR